MSNQRIVVAVDGSEPSLRAVSFAANLCQRLSVPLELVTVLEMAAFDPDADFAIPQAKVEALREKYVTRNLGPARDAVPDGVEVTEAILNGNPTEALLTHVTDDVPYMVVLGRTGKSALQRVLEGSVSKGLAELAGVPVCVVS